jgi:hypothetical protein
MILHVTKSFGTASSISGEGENTVKDELSAILGGFDEQ